MIEIVPNWHPIFVHFTVALLSLAVGLFIVALFMKPPLKEQWLIVARWTLWFGAGFTVVTGLTGLYAYNTVAHDTPSHVAMTNHRNWAIATIIVFLSLAIWSIVRVRRQQMLGSVFVVAMVISGVLLGSTAWRGGEVVYRYGLGVMSLPEAEGDGHAHEHADGEEHGHDDGKKVDTVKDDHHDDGGSHGHAEDGHHNDEPHAHIDNIDRQVGEKKENPAVKESMKSAEKSSKTHHDDGHNHEH